MTSASNAPVLTAPVAAHRRRAVIAIAALCAALAALLLFSLCLGRYPVPLAHVLQILLALIGDGDMVNAAWSPTDLVVVQSVRLPRAVVAIAAGFGLGLSGAALQGVFRNPLVDSHVIGISNAAACGGAFAIMLRASSYGVIGGAFAVGIGALLLVFGLARLCRGNDILTIVLAGIIISAFFSALIGVAEIFANPESQLPGIVYWLLGSLAATSAKSVPIIGIPTVIAGAALLLLRWRINLLSLGDADATALGTPVVRLRWTILALVSLITAAQVAVSGAIGWVGLVVPHITRRLVGPDHRYLLPASGLLGACYLLVVDDVARTVSANEIPIGVLTALIGTPVFALVFARARAKGWSHD